MMEKSARNDKNDQFRGKNNNFLMNIITFCEIEMFFFLGHVCLHCLQILSDICGKNHFFSSTFFKGNLSRIKKFLTFFREDFF